MSDKYIKEFELIDSNTNNWYALIVSIVKQKSVSASLRAMGVGLMDPEKPPLNNEFEFNLKHLQDLRAYGFSAMDIATMYECSEDKVRKACQKIRYRKWGHEIKKFEENFDYIVEQYKQGVSKKQIAKDTGINYGYFCSVTRSAKYKGYFLTKRENREMKP